MEATNVATNVKSTTTTNANGEYRLSNLPPGTYSIMARAGGFATTQLQNVRVALNQTATANIRLEISQAATTVNVTEAPAVIDTTTAQIQNTFETRAAQDLPSASTGLGVLNLSLLNAGVASTGGAGMGMVHLSADSVHATITSQLKASTTIASPLRDRRSIFRMMQLRNLLFCKTCTRRNTDTLPEGSSIRS